MEQSNAPTTPARPGLLSVLCILSMIGNGFMALVGLVGIFASGWLMSFITGKAGEIADKAASGEGMSMGDSMPTISMTAADAEATKEAVGGIASMAGGMIIAACVVLLLFSGLKFFGAMRMYKLKKGGFWLYVVPAALMTIGALISMQWIYGILSVLFIVGYAMNLKAMK